jgi:hypothetical protein
MKQLASVALNYGKSLKSEEIDLNEEHVYAEVNLVLSEPTYKLSNTGNIQKVIDVSECELYVTKASAKLLMDVFKKVHSKLIELEKRENKPTK